MHRAGYLAHHLIPFLLAALTATGPCAARNTAPRGDCADCLPEWRTAPGQPGFNTDVNALIYVQEPGGPVLYAGGSFTASGADEIIRIARFADGQWAPVVDPDGNGLIGGVVNAFAVFDDGTGPALYAAGNFLVAGSVLANRVAKWDGTNWSRLTGPSGHGVDFEVHALEVLDDGSGPAIYAAGRILNAGGQPASRIARWDGLQWSPLADPSIATLDRPARDVTVFDDGTGPAIYAAGEFITASGQPANHIARWDGDAWSPLTGPAGNGTNGFVYDLEVFDDGAGPALYAAGSFTTAGGITANGVARWDGVEWTPLVGPDNPDANGVAGAGATVRELLVYDDGRGPGLFVAGDFTTAGGQPAARWARWDGTDWTPAGPPDAPAIDNGAVLALAASPTGDTPTLAVGGTFTSIGGAPVSRVAERTACEPQPNACAWSDLGLPLTGPLPAWVGALAEFDDGNGTALYAAGAFRTTNNANAIARRDGAAWVPLGSGLTGGQLPSVSALLVHDDGTGPALYAAGDFTTAGGQPADNIARWDGAGWSTVGPDTDFDFRALYALAEHNDGSGPALYAGGEIASPAGIDIGLARWDGDAWTTIAGPTGVGNGGSVRALAVFAGDLYAAGDFTMIQGQTANRIARWDGQAWHALPGIQGVGVNATVHSLVVYDDGTGPALYAGGAFADAGGVAVQGVARWDGHAWSALQDDCAGGVSGGEIRALGIHDDGTGLALYAAGTFTTVAGRTANHIARWDGASWYPLIRNYDPRGANNWIQALLSASTPSGPSLIAGGEFSQAGGHPAARIAAWTCSNPPNPCPADLNADGSLDFFDLSMFIALFQAQDPTADFNNDGLFNFFDFRDYLLAFNAGCP